MNKTGRITATFRPTVPRAQRRQAFGASLALLVAGLALAAPSVAQSPGSLERFATWLTGEFNNHEQVWQQGEDKLPPQQRHEHSHLSFTPVDIPALKGRTFFLRQHEGGNYDRVERVRIYQFRFDAKRDQIIGRIYAVRNESPLLSHGKPDPALLLKLGKLGQDDLMSPEGCDIYWRYQRQAYVGRMKKGACRVRSQERGQTLTFEDEMRLSRSELRVRELGFAASGKRIQGRAEPHVYRKARRFKGWGLVRKNHLDPQSGAGNDEVFFTPGLRIHNEGQTLPLLKDGGEPTGYSVQLARLTYRGSGGGTSNGRGSRPGIPILTLKVIEDSSGKTLSYTWADIGATRIGINLRWMQCGLTAEEDPSSKKLRRLRNRVGR